MKRFISAFSFVTFGFLIFNQHITVEASVKAAKVAYSLPDCANFNISLSNASENDPLHNVGANGVKKVVLDAGHGGKDPGCSGKNSKEKDIALDITLRVGQLIKKHHPDVEVIYTRNKDEFVPLRERAAIANRNKADVFISIHCNTTAKRNSAVGTETFVMGLHKAEDNLLVAKRENSVIEHEQNYEAHYDGYDPNSDEGHIVLSMYQNAFLDQSISLANLIEDEFRIHGQRVSRGVKQAGFLVLKNTVMPSVLIEAGFLNNIKEETILTSEEGKDRSATAIFNAFTKYKLDMDKLAVNQTSNIEAIPVNYTATQSTAPKNEEKKIQEEESVNYVERAKQEMERMKQQKGQAKQTTRSEIKVAAAPEKPAGKPAKVSTTPYSGTSDVASVTPMPMPSTSQSEPESKIKPREKKLEYAVQLSAAATKLKTGGGKWDKVENVLIRYEDNLYKYQVGILDTYQQAVETKEKLKLLGFKDCFVVAYFNDQPINVKEALKLSN